MEDVGDIEPEYAELLELRAFKRNMEVLLGRLFDDQGVEGRVRIARVMTGVDLPTVLEHGLQTAVNAALDERDRARLAANRLRAAGVTQSRTLAILEGRE